MLIQISETCANCDYNDQGQVVDAAINLTEGGWPAAIYIDRQGTIWNLIRGEFQIMNIMQANVVHNF